MLSHGLTSRNTTPAAALRNYTHVFGIIGLGGAAAGVVFLLVSPWLSKWHHTHEHVG